MFTRIKITLWIKDIFGLVVLSIHPDFSGTEMFDGNEISWLRFPSPLCILCYVREAKLNEIQLKSYYEAEYKYYTTTTYCVVKRENS